MSLAEIDGAKTRRQLQEIAAAAKKSFAEQAERSAELNRQAREAFEREEAELKAVQQRKAEADAAKAAEEKAAEEDAKTPKRPKPSTLSLGGDEFHEARQAKQAAAAEVTPEPAPEPEPEPEPAARPTPTGRKTLKLGAPADVDETPPEPVAKPKPKRRPPAERTEGDDDLSGRTWLR